MHGAALYSRRTLPRSLFFMLIGVIAFALMARVAFVQDNHPIRDEPFTYSFHIDGTLEESSDFSTSGSDYWWLDSGGRLLIEEGVGKTIQRTLPREDAWRERYAASSAEDTDSGRHPQNLFRLLTQREWEDVSVSARFRIITDNESSSRNRNESNGLLLMSRYHDGDNLYYAGVRVDGHAIIKKKRNGIYTTLAELPMYAGPYVEKNLIPHNEWISLKSEVITRDGGVEITLSMKDDADIWQPILSASDTQSPILGTGHVGIRTDFMDVEFDDFRAERI
ncbi:hypothetical protein JNK62_03135 [bacterium]|nr:hypothetical protein [bacterium]